MRAKDISPPDLPMTPITAGIRRSLATSATLALVVNSMGVLAAPVGGKVTGGKGEIVRPNANTTVIRQTSHNLVVDWQGFNVAADEMVLFKQPGRQAGALNRIFDQNPSHIFGNIEANGRVFLMNPNGILFGKTAQVNVGALVASGLDVSKDDFMQGKLKFKGVDGTSGSVVNQGVLQAATGGSVDLVGKAVANEGKIIATAGQVNLAAGEQATLDFEGDGLMRFSVDEAVVTNAESLDAAVSNSGEINADGGHVVLTGKAAKDVFNKVVNNEGIIKAGRVDNSGGVVRLVGLGGGSSVLNTGTVDVSATAVDADSQPTGDGGEIVVTAHSIVNTGELKADATSGDGGTIVLESSATDSVEPATTELSGNAVVTAKSKTGEGGTVHLLGDQVGLFQQTLVDVSGGGGGGTVLVGGDVQGKNPKVKNAEMTVVAPDAKVQAKGIDDGAGGTVIVYADDHTEIYGELSVRGGEDGGGGGFIETSGKDSFVMQGKIDIAAGEGGKGGHWLIDPRSVEIDDRAAVTTNTDITNVAVAAGFTTYQPSTSGTVGVVSGSDLRTALGAGDVTIVTADAQDRTVNAAALEGDITFSSGFNFDGVGTGRTLTLRAADDIIISGAIMDGDTVTTGDSLNLVMVANSDGVDLASTTLDPGRGDIQINGAINLNNGNLVLSVDGGQVTQTEAIEAAGLVLLGTQSTGLGTPSYTLTNTGNDIDTLAGNVAGSINFLDTDDFEIGMVTYSAVSGANFDSSTNINIDSLTATSSITLSTTGTVTQSGIITASSLLLLGIGGTYTLDTQDNVITTLAGDTGTVSFRDDNGFTVGAMGSTDGLMTTGAIDLQSASGDITLAEDLTVTGNAALTLNAGTAGVTIANAADITLSTQGGDISVTAGGGVEGTEGGGDETLRLESGGGAVTLPAVNTGETTVDTGLAAFTISHDGASTIMVGTVDAGVFENREITATGDFALGAIDISGNLIINSGGANTITQTGAIGAAGLSLLGTGGTYTLNTQNNDITTLAGDTGTVSFRDDNGFTVGTVEGTAGLTATVSAELTATGTLSQSQAITTPTLTLLGGGAYSLTIASVSNDVNTLDVSTGTLSGDLSFRDDDGFAITAVNAGTNDVILTTFNTGTVTQSGIITANGLSLLGAGGTYTLNTQNNDVDILAGNTGTVSFRDDDGFEIGTVESTAGLAATGNVALTTSNTGTVTQSGIITANGLSLLGTGGIYTLNTQNNAITTLAGNTGTVSFQDDTGFAIGTVEGTVGLTATGNVVLSSTGTLSQSQAITTPTLTLLGRGIYNLAGANNDVDTLDVDDEIAMSLGGDLSFRDDDGFAITAVNAGTNDVILSSTGTVTQSGIITANGLSLLGTGGIYTLNTQNNAITTLAGNTGTVSFQDDNGFAIGTVEGTAGLTATVSAELTATGTLSQSQAITTPTLTLLGSGTYSLGSANNVVTTLDVSTGTLGGDLSFRDDDGFAITAVNAGTNDVILSSTGTVTQSGIITANGLSLLGTGGIYTLNTQNNAITTLAGNTGTVSFQDDTGFAIGTVEGTVGLTATGNVVLSSTGTVTQSGIITANGLSLLGTGGIYTLNTQNNAITTLAGNTGTVSFQDDTGFAIGTVEGTAGLTATVSAELTATGTLSQSQAITTPTLTLLGGGAYSLTIASVSNDVNTLDVSTGTLSGDLSFRDDDGFAITAVNAGTNDVILSSTGTVTQSGIITANGLSLLGTGGIYTLNTQNNAITTLAGNTGTVSFQDDNGFAIGTVEGTAGLTATVSAELTATGTLSQSQAITTPTLTLLGSGTYSLGSANNVVTTLDVSTGTLGGDLSFRDDDGFAITAVNAGTNDVILSSTGTVTQSGIITANGLSLLGTGGIYTLNTQNNAITTLAGNTGTVSFQDDTGFAIGTVEGTVGLTATGNVVLSSTGTLSQSQAITTPTLTLLGRGIYNLAGANNDVDTLDVDDEIAMSLGGDLSFRDDDGFAITAVNAGTNDVILSSTGTVTQSGIITANGLSLLGTGGIYTLNTQNNAITTLAGNTGTVSFQDNTGFAIGTVEGTVGLTATGNVVLSSTGTVTQSGIITANGLSLLGTGGIYTLNTQNNAITTLAGNTGTVSFQDNTGFAIGTVEGTVGLTATGNVVLSSTGTVTQSGIITANGLSLLGTGGIYTLNTQNNAITTLAGNTGTVSFQDDTGFAIGTVEGTVGLTATGNVVLSSTGTVTQSGIITANGLSLLGTGGIYTLDTQNNAITTLAGNTGTVSFQDDNGFAIGTVEGTAGLTATVSAELTATGTLSQSQAITTPTLTLLGSGTYSLGSANNVVTTLDVSTGTLGGDLSFRDDDGFAITAVNAGTNDVILSSTGTVTQSGIITANGLSLLGTGGIYTLNTQNNAITTLAGNTGTVSFQDNTGFAIGTVEGTAGLTATVSAELTATGTLSQSQAITTPTLTLLGRGIYNLAGANNDVDTLDVDDEIAMSLGGDLSFRDDDGFAITAVNAGTNDVILSSTGTVTQSGIITANGLSLLGTGGIYTLNTQNNAITTLAGNTGTVSFQDNTGFAIGTVEGTVGLTATGNVVLSSTGTVTQSGIITANGLSLLGTGGIYTLNTQNNAITTLAGNTGTVSFQDNTGFAIGTVEGTVGLTATGNVVLSSTGTVTQSGIITANGLSLLGTGGIYTLNTQNNAITTLAGNTGTVSFQDDTGFAIGTVEGTVGLTATGNVVLSSTGTVTQSGIITANGLSLLGTGGIYTLDTQNNAITTLAGNTGTVSFQDDNGFAIGTVEGTAGLTATVSAELTATGTLSQSQAITTPTLTLLGSGTYSLGSANNVVTTLDVSTGTLGGDLSFRDDDGFAITAVNAGTNDVILSSTGTVTQSGIITANGLSLLGTGGIYTLNTQNNAITTLAGNTGTVSFQDDTGFAIGTVEGTVGLTATGNVVLSSTGTLSQSQAITTPTLTLLGRGIYNLAGANNDVDTLDVDDEIAMSLGGDLSFRDDDGFAITAVNAGTNDVILSSTGTVTQSGIITANGLSLLGTGGIYTLNTQNNAITTLAGNTGTVSFQDNTGFAIGTVEGTVGLTATGNVVLSSTGTVTQSGIITANGLSLLGTGGIYTLNTQNNAITTLAGNTGTVSFQDNTGFAIGTVEGTVGLTATGNVVLSSTGTVTQSGIITANGLSLLGTGGIYTLNTQNNAITTLAGNTGTVSFQDDTGFAIGTVEGTVGLTATGNVVLSSTGTVTQSGIITANGLSLLGTGGIYTLNTQNNAITTLAGNTGTVSFQDNTGFAIGTVEGTAGLTATVSAELTATGTLSQSQAITTPTLTLLGSGTYSLGSANNVVTTLDVSTGTLGGDLSFRDDDGFAITAVNAGTNDVILSSTGTVTQSGIITANGLSLLGTGGIYTLNTQNNAITTLAGNTGTVSFQDDTGFAIGTVEGTVGLTATGNVVLSSTGTLSQSQAITTPTLTLLGRGIYNLAGANNDVDTLDVDDEIAMSLGGDLSFRDDDGFAITAVNAGTNDVILSSTGTVTQSGIITANGLSLLGTGGIYTLNTQNNAITTLAGNTGTVSFQDNTGFAIGTVEGTAGLTATVSAELTATGTLSQSQAITTPTLTLLGSGTYSLGSANNVVTTLDVSTGTLGGDLSFRDDDGFAITAVNAGTNDVILSSTGTVTQSGIITANGLSLLGTGGIYTLNTQNNAITTLAGNTGTVSFQDDNGFAIGTVEGTAGLAATVSAELTVTSTGTLSQSQAITTPTLTLLGRGIYNLAGANNDVDTLDVDDEIAMSLGGDLSFRDDDGFAITAVNAGTNDVTLSTLSSPGSMITITLMGDITQSAGFSIIFDSDINIDSSNDITLTSDTIDFNGMVTGDGTLFILPATDGNEIIISARPDNALPLIIDNTRFAGFPGALFIGGTAMSMVMGEDFIPLFTTPDLTATPNFITSSFDFDTLPSGTINIRANKITVTDHLVTAGHIVLLAGDIELESSAPIAITAGGRGASSGHNLLLLAIGALPTTPDPTLDPSLVTRRPPAGSGTIMIDTLQTLEAGYIGMVATSDVMGSERLVLALDRGRIELARGAGRGVARFNPSSLITPVSTASMGFDALLNIFQAIATPATTIPDPDTAPPVTALEFERAEAINPTTNLVGTAKVGFIDTGLFEEELTLFSQVGTGIALSLSQCEELEGCAPNVTEKELNVLIAELEERLAALEEKVLELRASEELGELPELEELINGYRAELDNFLAYREELKEFLSAEVEEEIDLEEDIFGDEFVEDVIKQLARALEHIKTRLEWLESLKGNPEARARLSEATGIELTQEALDAIIKATETQSELIEKRINLLLQGATAPQQQSSPYFTAESGRPSKAIDYAPYRLPMFANGVWWF